MVIPELIHATQIPSVARACFVLCGFMRRMLLLDRGVRSSGGTVLCLLLLVATLARLALGSSGESARVVRSFNGDSG